MVENSKSNLVPRLCLKIGRPSILTQTKWLNSIGQDYNDANVIRSIENKKTLNNLSFM